MTEFFGACPLDCPDGCSWVVTVEDGVATNLRGNRDHPYTAGALCAKVNGYLEHTRAADRLLYPLRRVGAKGEGRFERISWDDALREIASKLHAIRDEFGGEAIWPFQGTGSLGYVQGLEGRAGQALWNVLGASRHEMTACSVAGRIGASYTTGTAAGLDPETFTESKLILLWGTNPLTSGHHVFKFIRAAQKQGAHLVSIDPIRTRTSERCNEWLAPLPGTDAALAMGLMWVPVRGEWAIVASVIIVRDGPRVRRDGRRVGLDHAAGALAPDDGHDDRPGVRARELRAHRDASRGVSRNVTSTMSTLSSLRSSTTTRWLNAVRVVPRAVPRVEPVGDDVPRLADAGDLDDRGDRGLQRRPRRERRPVGRRLAGVGSRTHARTPSSCATTGFQPACPAAPRAMPCHRQTTSPRMTSQSSSRAPRCGQVRGSAIKVPTRPARARSRGRRWSG